ncbi:hypothetical protein CEXT_527631 [Caerostris extrusa]|uniref:Uncharacterized protein n=1 Tax=Caerostris extrusa TaxID=172846 RepID=A0AAV4NLS2_CAEEX|nr:hypothetical protein CEXT_527631 [Caerostris extrusa]
MSPSLLRNMASCLSGLHSEASKREVQQKADRLVQIKEGDERESQPHAHVAADVAEHLHALLEKGEFSVKISVQTLYWIISQVVVALIQLAIRDS